MDGHLPAHALIETKQNRIGSPITDQRIRRAIAHSVDYETFAALRAPGATIPTGVFGPAMLGYLDDAGRPTFDLAAATALVDEYKAANGVDEVTIVVGGEIAPGLSEDLEVLGQMVEMSGITIEYSPLLDEAAWGDANFSGLTEVDLTVRSFPGRAIPEEMSEWFSTFSCGPAPFTRGTPEECATSGMPSINFSRGATDALDALWDQLIAATGDDAERQRIAEEINREIGIENFHIPLYSSVKYLAGCITCGGMAEAVGLNGEPLAPESLGGDPAFYSKG